MTQRADRSVDVMGVSINTGSWESMLERVLSRSAEKKPAYICQCNVHSIVTAQKDPDLKNALQNAFIRAPDGMPIKWMVQKYIHEDQPRIGGPDLMWKLCEHLEDGSQSIFLFGSTEQTLNALRQRLSEQFPGLRIAGFLSPPFRPLSEEELDSIVNRINDSGASIVFVGLGCPKQEIWMSRVSARVSGVMIGVGAAFDFHAGLVSRAPQWMQRLGLEWVHRLLQEPGRLWKRYLSTNSVFALYVCRRLIGDFVRRRSTKPR